MNKTKMIVDVVMLIFFAIVMAINVTGTYIHEILGIAIWVLFVVHLLLNRKWIGAVTKNLFGEKIKASTKFNYIIDLGIFVSLIVETISGILISKYLFVFITVDNMFTWTDVHKIFAYITAGLMSLHLFMHFSMVVNYFSKKNTVNGSDSSKMKARFVTAGIFIASILSYIFSITQYNQSTTVVDNKDLNSDEIVVPESIISNTTSNTNSTVENTATSNTTISNSTSTNTTTSTTNTTVSEPVVDDSAAIQKLLSSIHCTGCGRRCLLSNPKCGIGETQAEIVIEQYNQTKQ